MTKVEFYAFCPQDLLTTRRKQLNSSVVHSAVDLKFSCPLGCQYRRRIEENRCRVFNQAKWAGNL